MMNSKITKIIVNGTVLAVIAVLGITAYQMRTTTVKPQEVPQELSSQTENEQKTQPEIQPEKEPLVDAGTSHVEASMEEEDESLNQAGEGTEAAAEEELEEGTQESTQEEAQETSGTTALNFSENTLMEWPVNGTLLLDYSMDQTIYFPTLDQYKLSSAIAVSAVEDAPVMAAADGVIYSITQEATTGTTVTVELGNGYQAIYGQLKDLTVEEGQKITKGEILGYISAPTKYYSREGCNLYYAMKKDGTPIDPIQYLP